MDDLPGTLARLTTSLEALERRVYALEHPSQMQPPALVQADTQTATAHTAPALPSTQAGGAFSVVGKAMLGIAGAYLLRAMAMFPHPHERKLPLFASYPTVIQ